MLSSNFLCSKVHSESKISTLGLEIPRVESTVADDDDPFYVPSYFDANALGLEIPRGEQHHNNDGSCPHELWKQPKGGLCLLYSVLNALNSIDDCHRFLGHPEKIGQKHIEFEECLEFLDFAYRFGQDWQGEGLNFSSIVDWIKIYGDELGIKDGWIVRSTNMKLKHLLLSMKDEKNKNYVIFGDATTDDELLKAAKSRLTGVQAVRRNRKRRFAEISQKSFADLYHKFADQFEVHSRVAKRIAKVDKTPHAVTVKFNEKGIPFLYDPGKNVAKELPPTVRNGQMITEEEFNRSVHTFVNSLIMTKTIYKIDIQFM